MKNAILLHGTGDSPESFWFPYLHNALEERDYDVWAPQLPEHETPKLKTQLPYLLSNGAFNSETIIIAHSAGCPLTLALLEKIEVKIKQVILVAGFVKAIGKLQDLKAIVKEDYDWNKIKANVSHFIAIHSDNDPWDCNDDQGRIMLNHVGGMLIIRHGDGHMGSVIYNQPYKEFPLLLKLID